MSYCLPFGVIFYLICGTSMVQLVLCIRAEFSKTEKTSVVQACKLTIQKLLYFFVIFATGSRAVYFSTMMHLPEPWKENLFTSYYPFLLSGFSLIICFWAEVFHLGGVPLHQSKFLTKSSIACAIFNVFVYMILFAQCIASRLNDIKLKMHLTEIFSGLIAFSMFVALVFFLVYGVEIFCKINGEFLQDAHKKDVNDHQVLQSRLGVLAQGSLQLATTCFLILELGGSFWKDKINLFEKNAIEIAFRIIELGVALWFPCVLWNVHRPDELWILNPRKLLRLRRQSSRREADPLTVARPKTYMTFPENEPEASQDCWICYDISRDDAGPLISPCHCKGDTSTVHHECLKTWLMESLKTLSEIPRCKVCQAQYRVCEGYTWITDGFQTRAWLQFGFIIIIMVAFPLVAWMMWNEITQSFLKIVIIGGLMVAEYLCLKLLGFNFITAYKRARVKAMKILDSGGLAVSERSQSNTLTEAVVETKEMSPIYNIIE